MPRIRLIPIGACAAVLVAALFTGTSAGASAQAAGSSGENSTVPYQYISKLYTEALGRLPSQGEWSQDVAYFQDHSCGEPSLEALGEGVLLSSDFSQLGYGNASRVLAATRMILNRDPTTAELTRWSAALGSGSGDAWPTFITARYSSAEFGTLTAQICDPTDPSYHFGTTPPPDMPAGHTGFTGTEAQLQAVLNATPAGGTVTLAARAAIPLTTSLTIPADVRLTTSGDPDPTHYANMARLFRASVTPGFDAPMVFVRPGAALIHVWVDGQRGTAARFIAHEAYTVQTFSGNGTTVDYDVLSNSAGGTNLSALGGTDTGTNCVNNDFSYNLTDGYAGSHWAVLTSEGGVIDPWADGLSIACEDARVTGNQIVDPTDTGLIIFAEAGRDQRSVVTHNVILNAGNSAYASLYASPNINIDAQGNLGPGDPPGQASRDFTGAVMSHNLFWTSPAAPNAIGISLGVTSSNGQYAYNGHGITVTDNTTGREGLWAGDGIVVSGMLNATVLQNQLNTHVESGTALCTTTLGGIYQECGTPSEVSLCPPTAIGADITGGTASGDIQGPYLDTPFSACIVGIVQP